ncbi:MAG: hypothetical protein JW745_06115, partial [Sedimentisphaerales bacterium]|nr:hypothetical protein [Sedimentisphaerales bacterium]
FPSGSSYSVMVLPAFGTMTPELLARIGELVEAGAVVIGEPPVKSPSLVGYPHCDEQVKELAVKIWGSLSVPEVVTVRKHGKGAIYWGGELSVGDGYDRGPILGGSNWIWYNEGEPSVSAETETIYFKRQIELTEGRTLERARVAVTADNSFVLYVNGKRVAEGDNFNIIKEVSVERYLQSGENIIAVSVTNDGESNNPAGLIAALELVYKDGTVETIYTDTSWYVSREVSSGWQTELLSGHDKGNVLVSGPATMSPWHLNLSASRSELYPAYEATATVLGRLGIEEDFSADGPLRYGHRQSQAMDIYFVSNSSDKAVKCDCRFRVDGGRAELWDPVTGERRILPEVHDNGSQRVIPLRFAAYQSYFVVFVHSSEIESATVMSEKNFEEAEPVVDLAGPWQVAFDPVWGGPSSVVFDELMDWTMSEDQGIKYYSGIAIYSKVFELSLGISAGERVYLDLGEVYDMARVRLNGEDLGVVWCAPWQVDITQAVKSGENKLEIEVANRWVNRLAGDRAQADAGVRMLRWDNGMLGGQEYRAGRYTFTTGQGYDNLLPAGLTGPIKIKKFKR